MTALLHDDMRFMDVALAAAFAQLGRTAPNPAVGCALVRDGQMIAVAATADGGRPHAERQALELAGEAAAGSTAYVSLEPCAHYGQTPPCADALIEARIARVVVACVDEHPKVAGEGLRRLQAAGIDIVTGLREPQAKGLYEGFFHRLRTGRPKVYIDARTGLFDAVLDTCDMGELDARLAVLGEQGVNRVCVLPNSPLARELTSANTRF